MIDQLRTPFYDIQQRIHEWAEVTFGSANHPYPLYKRIKDELDELNDELGLYGVQQTIHSIQTLPSVKTRIAKECADVAITLFRFCGALGIDLLSEVEKKQDINESRRWVAHGDGTGKHIKNEGGI